MTDQPSLPANSLGVAGVVVGILSLMVGLLPTVGVLAVPGSLLGGVLSLVGLILALTSRRTGAGWPVAGIGLNFAAVVVATLVIMADHADDGPDIQPPQPPVPIAPGRPGDAATPRPGDPPDLAAKRRRLAELREKLDASQRQGEGDRTGP